MTTAPIHLHMKINIFVPRNATMIARPSLKLEFPHWIDPDVEEVALILTRQRLQKPKTEPAIVKTKMKGSTTRSSRRSITKKSIKMASIKAKPTSCRSFLQRPLPPPPVLPTLRPGEIILFKK